MNKKGLTLLELLMAIAIAVIIAGALYLTLNAALESWEFTKDHLALQKVLNQTAEKIATGTVVSFGLKDSLEVSSAGKASLEFVPPWTNDTHSVAEHGRVYTLVPKIKPGAGIPIAEVRKDEDVSVEFVSVILFDEEDTAFSKVALKEVAPLGCPLFFIYHPDAKSAPDAIKKIWWDSKKKQVFSEHKGESSCVSKNNFGVNISKMELKYYDKANNLITKSNWVDDKDLNFITGIEIEIEAELGQYKSNLISFVCLRNAPMRSGYITISEGMSIPIPDSYNIHSLLIRSLSGVSNEDVLQLKATPKNGKIWRVRFVFSRPGSAKPKIDRYVIEYPVGYEVYTEYPKIGVESGIDLLSLGPRGRYDYDYDGGETEDVAVLEGEVQLEVERMDMEGAGLFIRP